MTAEPLLRWPEPILAFFEFIGVFLAAGAIGFRYFVTHGAARAGDSANTAVYADAVQRAAMLGFVGAILGWCTSLTRSPG